MKFLSTCGKSSNKILLHKLLLCLCACVAVLLISHSYTKERFLFKSLCPVPNNTLSPKDLALDLRQRYLSGPSNGDTQEKRLCPIIDFFATIDISARIYDPHLLCDDFAERSDIVCRMYFRQIGLTHLERSNCALEKPNEVPRVVYFVIFGTFEFKFVNYIAFLAAKRYVAPPAIYVIGDRHPVGKWWQQVLQDVHGVRFLYRQNPANISGQPINFKHHLSDIVRLQTLYMNGGIYLDADMVVVSDISPLLDYDITLGMLDKLTGMGNAFIATKRGSTFIREWYTEYTHYKKDVYFYNSLQVPRQIWLKNKSRVHMESDRLYRPNWFEAGLLFNGTDFPWRNNYAVHVWTNRTPVPKSPDEIQTTNTTVAQIFRHVMYGDSRPRFINDTAPVP